MFRFIVLNYHFAAGGRGGTILDPSGSWVSAVEALRSVYGARLDWILLIEELEKMPGEEPKKAAGVARQWYAKISESN